VLGTISGEMIDSTRGHPDGRRNHALLLTACVVVFGCSLAEPWGALVLLPALITLALSIVSVYVDARKRRPLAMGIAGILFSLVAVVVAILWWCFLVQAADC
jgi:hypothetical protein